MELLKKGTLYNLVLLAFILAFGSYQNVASAAVTNCGVIIRPDPEPLQNTPLENGDWPWLATFYRIEEGGFKQVCLGTLVSLRAIITTASCLEFFKNPIDDTVIRFDRTNPRNWNDRSVISPPIKTIITHPNHDRYQERDIAIVELQDDIQITDFVKPACLWTDDNSTHEGSFGFQAQWTGNVAYRTSAPLIHNETCLPTRHINHRITLETTFCTANLYTERSRLCYVNRGTGLLFKQNGRWALRGILIQECEVDYELYVDVAKLSDWILSNLPKPDAPPGVLESAAEICGQTEFGESQASGTTPVWKAPLQTGEWPWMAAIYSSDESSLRLEGLGTLISSRTVLTASRLDHFKYNKENYAHEFFVRLGQTNFANANQANVLTSSIKYFVSNWEIGIAVLTEKIRFTNNIRPACLWSGNADSIADQYGFIARWESNGDKSGTRISPKVFNETTCLQISNDYQQDNDLNRIFCAGKDEASDDDQYYSTTGAGLLVKSNGRWMIRGVVFEHTVARTDNFIICTDIAKTIDWIKSVHSQIEERDTTSLLPSMTETEDICGQVYPNFNYTRLAFGGFEIQRGSWPWLVAIFKKRNNISSFICGGTLISTKFILSAAHCFYDRFGQLTSNDTLVYLGLHQINKIDDFGVISPSVKSICVHRDYRRRRKESDADIAIITLSEPITFTEYIRPACVWTDSDASYNQIGSVVGWGRYETGDISEKPRQVYPRIVDPAECLQSNDAFSQIASRRSLCAGNRDNFGPCQGDSGGGLLVEKNGRLYVRGIVSVALLHPSSGCDLSEYVVYSDVSKFVDWIRDITTNENCS